MPEANQRGSTLDLAAPLPGIALSGRDLPGSILFLGHEASRTGAPLVLLHLIRWLCRHTSIRPSILLVEGGPLEEEFRALGPTWLLSRAIRWDPPRGLRSLPLVPRWLYQRKLRRIRREILGQRPELIYANSAACHPALRFLDDLNVPVVAHIHELELMLRECVGDGLDAFLGRPQRLIAASLAVRDNLVERHRLDPAKIDIIHEFIPTAERPEGDRAERRRLLNKAFGLEPDATLVGAVGTAEWRKGGDLFVSLARSVLRRFGDAPVHFLWVGGGEIDLRRRRHEVELAGLADRVHFIGPRPDPLNVIDLFDVFALTSREDPYPLVVLEAAALGKPIVCFDRSGGACEFVGDDCGFTAPYLDLEAMADRIVDLLDSPRLRHQFGEAARSKVQSRHDISIAGPEILGVIRRFAASAPPTTSPSFATKGATRLTVSGTSPSGPAC